MATHRVRAREHFRRQLETQLRHRLLGLLRRHAGPEARDDLGIVPVVITHLQCVVTPKWNSGLGQTLNVPLQWTGDRDGQYRGSFVSAEAGAYEVTVDASRGAESIGTG